MGTLLDENDTEVSVVGLYSNAPAATAGVKPGDIIVSIADEPVTSMAGLFRSLWRYGPAGTGVPLTLSSGSKERKVVLDTIDRNSFFMQHAVNTIN